MSSEPTPGVNRLVTVTVNGHPFGYRKPSRADVEETKRRMAVALISDLHAELDEASMEWQCAFIIGLQPRVRNGTPLNLGEMAPAHWFTPLFEDKADPTKQTGRFMSFDEVPNEEFLAVCAAVGAALVAEKKS